MEIATPPVLYVVDVADRPFENFHPPSRMSHLVCRVWHREADTCTNLAVRILWTRRAARAVTDVPSLILVRTTDADTVGAFLARFEWSDDVRVVGLAACEDALVQGWARKDVAIAQ